VGAETLFPNPPPQYNGLKRMAVMMMMVMMMNMLETMEMMMMMMVMTMGTMMMTIINYEKQLEEFDSIRQFPTSELWVESYLYKGSIPNTVGRMRHIQHFTGLACGVTAGVVIVDTTT